MLNSSSSYLHKCHTQVIKARGYIILGAVTSHVLDISQCQLTCSHRGHLTLPRVKRHLSSAEEVNVSKLRKFQN